MKKSALSISDIISKFGNQSKMARILSISPQAIQRWVSTGKLPIRRALQIERITKGELRLEDIIHLTNISSPSSSRKRVEMAVDEFSPPGFSYSVPKR